MNLQRSTMIDANVDGLPQFDSNYKRIFMWSNSQVFTNNNKVRKMKHENFTGSNFNILCLVESYTVQYIYRVLPT